MEGSQLLAELVEVLQRRDQLRKSNGYYDGASQRDPNYSAADETAWDEVIAEVGKERERLRMLARRLRREAPGPFAEWVGERRAVHEAQLAETDLPDWERRYLLALIARWERFTREEFEDFFRWGGW